MAYHHELLDLASLLAKITPPPQAGLRRSVFSTYYAVFHLLISEAIKNWSRDSSRSTLGRMFEHEKMRKVSESLLKPTTLTAASADPQVIEDLKFIAKTFLELQKKRHSADYDNNIFWEHVEALRIMLLGRRVFATWDKIKNEDIAQEYRSEEHTSE